MTETLNRWTPHVLSLLRLFAGLIFLEHGTQKILGFPPSPGAGPLPTLLVGQGWIELVGGILFLIFAGGGPWSVDALIGQEGTAARQG